MTTRILIELALFLTPFFIFFLFRAASQDMSVKDRWPLGILVAAGGVLAVGALVFAALREPSTKGLCYQAEYLEDGVWKGGELVPCEDIISPRAQGANSAAGELKIGRQPEETPTGEASEAAEADD